MNDTIEPYKSLTFFDDISCSSKSKISPIYLDDSFFFDPPPFFDNKLEPENEKTGDEYKLKYIPKKKTHTKYSEDNILRKLNTYFLNFIINFINVIISEKKNIDIKFKKINHQYKKRINKKNFSGYKNKTIGELLNLDNDKKFKNFEINRNLYGKINAINDSTLNNILSKRYIDIFKEVFYENEKNFNHEGKNLIIPNNFLDFLNKENDTYKNKVKKVIEKYYFPKTKLFIVQKIGDDANNNEV